MRLSACDSWDAKVVRDEAEHFAVATAVPNSVDDCPGKESAPRHTNDALGPKFIHSLRRMSSRRMSHSSATTVDAIGSTPSLIRWPQNRQTFAVDLTVSAQAGHVLVGGDA
jgi:hypothetical protein